ncbi:MAG: VOC family protein [Thermoleophilia bacterium]
MLSGSQIHPTLPVSDLARAGRFYEDSLGLKLAEIPQPQDAKIYEAGDCTRLLTYKTEAHPSEATAAFFLVDDLEGEMKNLREHGVAFEDYDLPNLRTENGIYAEDGMRAAWFKDTEGNILSLTEMVQQS